VGFRRLGVMLTNILDVYPVPAPWYPPSVQLPPLPALTAMGVTTDLEYLSARLTDILLCIRSAPALSCITFRLRTPFDTNNFRPSDRWISVDKWLAQLAAHAKAKGKGSLVVVLTPWPGRSLRRGGGYLPEFTNAGGELTIETSARRS